MYYMVNDRLFNCKSLALNESHKTKETIQEYSLTTSPREELESIFYLPSNEILKRIAEISLVGNHSVMFYGTGNLNFDFPISNYYKICLCGYLGHHYLNCVCNKEQIKSNFQQIINESKDYDIFCEVRPISQDELTYTIRSKQRQRLIEPFNDVIQRIEIAKKFLEETNINRESICEIGETLLKTAIKKLGLTESNIDSIMRLSITISAMDGKNKIKPQHIAEAIQYSQLNSLLFNL